MSYAIPDPRWEEFGVLTPRRRPVRPVVVDKTHPLGRNCVVAVVPFSLANVESKKLPLAYNGQVADGYKGWQTFGDEGDFIAWDTRNLMSSEGFSLYWFGDLRGTVERGNQRAVCLSADSAETPRAWIGINQPESLQTLRYNSNDGTNNAIADIDYSPFFANGQDDNFAAISVRESYSSRKMVEHIHSLSVTDSTALNSTLGANLVSYSLGAPYYSGAVQSSLGFKNRTMVSFVWSKPLTDAELASIHRDPYQFLIPA